MISREILDQLRHLLRPIAVRAANTVARGVVRIVDDSTKMQLVQIGVLAGETIDNAEHFQPYGFSSVPLAGAEHVTVFPNGDRSHPLTIAVADRRYKPTGRQPGDVTMHHYAGAQITMTKDGDIEVQPAPGRQVFVRSAGGTADRLVTKSEFDGHTHGPGSFSTPSAGGGGGPVTGTSGGAAAVAGTQKLQAE